MLGVGSSAGSTDRPEDENAIGPAVSAGRSKGVAEVLFAVIAAALGAEPVGYAQHLGRVVIQDVLPLPEHERVQAGPRDRSA